MSQSKSNLCQPMIKTEIKIEEEDITDEKIKKELYSENHKTKIGFPCLSCEKVFPKKANLNVHIKSVHLKIKSFQCELCQAAFATKCTLKQHIFGVHEKMRNFECQFCHLKFFTKDKMASHIVVVHDKFKAFVCDVLKCKKAFGTKSNLQRHKEIVHEGKKSFDCKLCSSLFSTSGNLKAHIDAVHEKKKSYSCDSCDFRFNHPNSLKRHKINVHENPKKATKAPQKLSMRNKHKTKVYEKPKKSIDEKSKILYCDACDLRCIHPNSLKRHKMKVHGNQKKTINANSAQKKLNINGFFAKSVKRDKINDHDEKNTCVPNPTPLKDRPSIPCSIKRNPAPTKERPSIPCSIKRSRLISKIMDKINAKETNESLNVISESIHTTEAHEQKRNTINNNVINAKNNVHEEEKNINFPIVIKNLKAIIENENKKSKKCKFCDLRFTHPSALSRHKKEVHEELKNSNVSTVSPPKIGLTCRFCFKTLPRGATENQLRRHEMKFHLKFACEHCPKRFTTEIQLSNHYNLFHEVSSDNIKFSSKNENVEAVAIKDDDCIVYYTDLGQEDPKTVIVPYQNFCDFCSYPYNCEEDLINHTVKEHPWAAFKMKLKLL